MLLVRVVDFHPLGQLLNSLEFIHLCISFWHVLRCAMMHIPNYA